MADAVAFEHEVLNAPAQGTDAWLEWRKQGITATEAGVIMHPAYKRSALTVYTDKLGITTPDQSDEEGFMEWGHRIEDLLVNKFMEIHPDFHDCTQGRLYQWEWRKCSLDAQCFDGDGKPVIIECKTGQALEKWDDGKIPENYFAQVQWQMRITGIRRAFFSVLIQGHIYFEREVKYDPEYVDELEHRCRVVWDAIQIKTPPAIFADGEADKTAIAALAGESGHTGEPQPISDSDVAKFKELKEAADKANNEFENFKNRLGFTMVETSKLVKSNGKVFASWVERKGSVTVDKALLQAKYPDVYEKVLKQGAGSRYIKYNP